MVAIDTDFPKVGKSVDRALASRVQTVANRVIGPLMRQYRAASKSGDRTAKYRLLSEMKNKLPAVVREAKRG